jgi:glycosyltransferase involved in cell wall biosynthesis
MSTLRLAFFDFNNNFGGAPQGALHLAERLAKVHEVHIVDVYGKCEPYRQAIREANLPYHVLVQDAKRTYIGGSGIGRMAALSRQLPDLWRVHASLSTTILGINPDIVWVMNEKSLTFVTMNRRLKKYPCALYVQGWGTPDQVGWRLRWLMKHKAAAVLAVSTATLYQLRKAGVPESKLFLGSMTIDIEEVKRDAQEPPVAPLPGNELSPKILMLAARPEVRKGHITAYKAIARLKSAGYNSALWLTGKLAVGAGNNFVEELHQLAKELNIVDNVFFLGWRDNIPAIINAADICILPSHTEGFPRSILESMVLRRPVIATTVGGVGDSIKDGETGFLMPVDDDEALADKIQWIIANPEETQKITKQGYDYTYQHFHPDDHTKRILDIFEKIKRTR